MPVTVAAVIGLLFILGALSLVWLISLRQRDASIADICWGPAFALLGGVYLMLLRPDGVRPRVVLALVTVWGLRLGLHILRRHRGEDPRYAAMRAARGQAFWWRSLFVVFWLQGVILWIVALPLLAVAAAPGPPRVTAADLLGSVLFAAGFTFEVVGDWQLARFRRNPANRGAVLDTGLWRYTRHPNYFGDALLWWGFYAIACATPWGWATFAGPALMTFLLLRVSGAALLEQGLRASKPAYADYVARTPAFVPWWPRRR